MSNPEIRALDCISGPKSTIFGIDGATPPRSGDRTQANCQDRLLSPYQKPSRAEVLSIEPEASAAPSAT
ncbi:hypothetical protein GCM10009599_09120 [Luteococcus peritonei]